MPALADIPGSAPARLPAVPAVAVLVPEFPSQAHAGLWRQVTAWRDAGATVELVSTRRPPDDACRHDFAGEARRQTHYLHPPQAGRALRRLLASPRRLRSALGYVRGLRESGYRTRLKTLALLGGAADLVEFCRDRNVRHVHCHSFAVAAHACAMARRLGGEGGPTYSLSLHGDLPAHGTDHRRKLEACAAVACDGPRSAGQLTDLGYPAERVLPDGAGIDTDAFTPGDAPAEPGRLRLITVARLDRNQGHRPALAAVRRLVEAGRDVTYTLVGEGPSRDEIRAEVRRLELCDRVTMAGTMPEAQTRDALRRHDAFCLPGVGLGEGGEGGTAAVMGAMACGLPVVAGRAGATAAMIRDGQSGLLCDPQDVAALAASFEALAADPDRRRAMGEAARRHAVEHFDSRRRALRLFEHVRRWTPETFGRA